MENKIYNIIVIGSESSGKTTFCKAQNKSLSYETSEIGEIMDEIMYKHKIKYQDKDTQLNLIDTSHSVFESFKYPNNTLCVVMFDASKNFDDWLPNWLYHLFINKYPVVLFANKYDNLIGDDINPINSINDRLNKLEYVCEKLDITFYRTDSKNGIYYTENRFDIITEDLIDLCIELCEKNDCFSIVDVDVDVNEESKKVYDCTLEELDNFKLVKENNCNISSKIAIFGDENSGKTCFWKCITGDEFDENYKSTIGVDFNKIILTAGNYKTCTQLWDTSGNKKYINIVQSYIRGCAIIILMFDVSSEKSFNNMDYWRQLIQNEYTIPIVVVGNKSDLGVNESCKIKEYCDKYKFEYCEISTKNSHNFDKLLNIIGKMLYNKKL